MGFNRGNTIFICLCLGMKINKLFIYLFIYLLTYLFIHSFIYSFINYEMDNRASAMILLATAVAHLVTIVE